MALSLWLEVEKKMKKDILRKKFEDEVNVMLQQHSALEMLERCRSMGASRSYLGHVKTEDLIYYRVRIYELII